MNLKTFAKAVRRSAGKNASKILGGLAITGSITAVYFAVTATPKAMILLDEKKQELGVEKLDVKTIVKTAGPVYVPTALSMVLSAGCVIGASLILSPPGPCCNVSWERFYCTRSEKERKPW